MPEAADQRAPRERAMSSRAWRRALPSALLALGLLGCTIVAFVMLDRNVRRTERTLLEARGRDIASRVESLSIESTATFGRAATAARATRGDPARLAQLLQGMRLPPILSNVFLVRVDGARPEILFRVGPNDPLVIHDLSARELGVLRRLPAADGERLLAVRRGDSFVAAYGMPIGQPGLVLIEELAPREAMSATFGSEDLLYGAVYFGPVAIDLALLATNAPTTPLPSPDLVRTVHFADGTPATLVIATRRPLVGVSSWRARWFVLGIGIAMSVLLGLGSEALRRRRDHALTLVGDLRESNAYLDELGAKLSTQAFRDSLTGLPNRARLLLELDHALQLPDDASSAPALLVVDLDGFKEVNDVLGHHTGDALLCEVANRLAACVGDEGVAARLGGDEFAVLLPASSDRRQVTHLAERIVAELERPVLCEAREVVPGGSIGICRREGGEDADELLRNADIAMYRVKSRDAEPRWEWFTPSMLEEFRDRIAMAEELREGVADGQFVLEFQPIKDLRTHRTVSAEALVRWDHPRRGRIPPAAFIPLAEETGAILDLGRWVLWQRLGAEIRVSVNVSGRQLQEPGIVGTVRDALARAGLDAQRLVVEITESVLIEDEGVTARLQDLRDLGVQIAIDDFGSGYSSIGYLQRFPLDILKIDRMFVSQGDGPRRGGLLESIVSLGRSLDLQTVAEGVETTGDEEGAKFADCDYAQGYLLSYPLGADDFARLVLAETADAALQIAATVDPPADE